MSKSKKLPALQFYPGDWKKDLGIQALSFEEKGVWLELLFLMHEADNRGYLELNGQPMSDETVGKILGIHGNKWKKIKRKLEVTGVMSIDENSGILYNRRMVRDEEKRKKDRENGKLGGNPKLYERQKGDNPLVENRDNPTPNPKAPPSISTSTSTSTSVINKLTFPPKLDNPECHQAWADWLEYKRERKESYKSVKSQNMKLREWSEDPAGFVKAVASSIGNNYAGIFPPRQNNSTTGQFKPHTAASTVEKNLEFINNIRAQNGHEAITNLFGDVIEHQEKPSIEQRNPGSLVSLPGRPSGQ